MNKEVNRILDQYRRSCDGEAWHGPALLELVESVNAVQAASHPIKGAHSIWEIIGHIMTWQNVFAQRLAGQVVNEVPDEQNFPPVANPGPAAWKKTQEALIASCTAMKTAIAGLADERLDEIVPGKSYTLYVMLHGIIQHNLYHAGQIALLRKA